MNEIIEIIHFFIKESEKTDNKEEKIKYAYFAELLTRDYLLADEFYWYEKFLQYKCIPENKSTDGAKDSSVMCRYAVQPIIFVSSGDKLLTLF